MFMAPNTSANGAEYESQWQREARRNASPLVKYKNAERE